MRSTEAAATAEPSVKPPRLPEKFFDEAPQQFVGTTPGGTIVYVGVKDRAEFDKIAAPCMDNGENERGHVLVKNVGGFKSGEVTVIFQHWLKSLTSQGHMLQRRLAERQQLVSKSSLDAADQHRIVLIEAEITQLGGAELLIGEAS